MVSVGILCLHTLICGVSKCSDEDLKEAVEKITNKTYKNNTWQTIGVNDARIIALTKYPELNYLTDPRIESYTGCPSVYNFYNKTPTPPTPPTTTTHTTTHTN